MIPLFWRYLIREQMKVTCLCLVGFVLLLLLLRVEEIARFATMGAPLEHILLFTAMMLPQLLQLSIPLAVGIGVYSCGIRMSQSCELLGALTSGISARHFLGPLLGVCLFWATLNGCISSIWAPNAQMEMRLMKTYWSQLNPSHLLKSERMWPFPGAVALSSQDGNKLDVTLISHHSKQNSSQLLHFKDVDLSQSGQISTQASTHIIFYPEENSQYMSLENVASGNYNFLMNQYSSEALPSFAIDQIPLSVLLHDFFTPEKGSLSRASLLSEMARRFFFFILPFGFTCMAMQASFKPDRRSRQRMPLELIIWVGCALVFYFAAKSGFPNWRLQILFYLLPSFIGSILGIYLLTQKRNPR
jgi:lipopolysaccharide export system permease protein